MAQFAIDMAVSCRCKSPEIFPKRIGKRLFVANLALVTALCPKWCNLCISASDLLQIRRKTVHT